VIPGCAKCSGEKERARGLEKIDECGMMEKYLHSQGAILFDEKRFGEAIEFFHKGIELDDQPYTRFHLSLAYKQRIEFDKALQEITRAIELSPCVPEYYYERSLVWQRRGDHARASLDYERAVGFDENYRRIEQIRSSADTIGSVFAHLEGGSCPVHSCPAYCCHFTGEPVRHGVHIGAGKLYAIRGFLKERGFREQDFLDKLPYNGEKHLSLLIPPNYMLKEHGRRFVYYPKRASLFLDDAVLKDLPKGKDYQTLMWINEKARPCAFLHEKKCLIHNVGEESGLDSCKQFFCMTGFVFLILKHLGIADEAQIQARKMNELNRIAVEALLILSDRAHSGEGLEMSTEQSKRLKNVWTFR